MLPSPENVARQFSEKALVIFAGTLVVRRSTYVAVGSRFVQKATVAPQAFCQLPLAALGPFEEEGRVKTL